MQLSAVSYQLFRDERVSLTPLVSEAAGKTPVLSQPLTGMGRKNGCHGRGRSSLWSVELERIRREDGELGDEPTAVHLEGAYYGIGYFLGA